MASQAHAVSFMAHIVLAYVCLDLVSLLPFDTYLGSDSEIGSSSLFLQNMPTQDTENRRVD
jgi:hypothetical protein